MTQIKHKDDRVCIRLDTQQKSVIDRAAVLLGVSRSSFMLSNAVEAASRVIEQQHQISLSERDWDTFASLVSSDVEPTPAAREAAKRYKGR